MRRRLLQATCTVVATAGLAAPRPVTASISWSQLTMAPCDSANKYQKFSVEAPSGRGRI